MDDELDSIKSVNYDYNKEECVVANSKDLYTFPIFGDGSVGIKFKFKIKKLGVLLITLVVLLSCGSFFLFKTISEKNFSLLKKNYGQFVILRKDSSLYDSHKKVIGSVQNDLKLELVKIKELTSKDKYLKVKDTDYYVYYKDIKKTREDKKKDNTSYYVSLGKNIEGEGKVTLYKDKDAVIELKKGITAPIEYMDKDNYYVGFLNDTYKVKKTKNVKEVNGTKSKEKKAEHVSMLYYNLIDDNCYEDTCFKLDSVRAHINTILGSGYYAITKEDYLNYINGYINLKPNAVLFATGTLNDNTKVVKDELGVDFAKFEDKDGVKFNPTNKPSTPNDDKSAINFYNVKRYFIIDEYNRMASGGEVVDNGPQTNSNQSIAVMNYHFFFDSSLGEECNESICLEASKLREQLQWLKDNGYKTLTIKEFTDWMYGIIELPEKSVLLTIDDGAKGTGAHNGNKLIPLLEEFKMNATLFLIAGWWDIGNYKSPYLDVQSHTFNLHYEASCADGRGKVACSNYQEVKDDLQQSIDVIKDKTSFCFPFYSSDRESIQAVQDLGFRVAFVGGNTKARRSNNKYLIPRYPIMNDISLQEFINIVS